MSTTTRDNFVERRQYFDGGYMLIERADVVMLALGTEREGVSPSGKAWSRWSNHSWWWFSAKRVGADGRRTLNMYHSLEKSRGQHQQRTRYFRNVTSAYLSISGGPAVDAALRSAVISLHGRMFGEVPERFLGLRLRDLFAALALPGLAIGITGVDKTLPHTPVQGISPALRALTARQRCEALFGKRRTRKDLIRAAAVAAPADLLIAHHLRQVVPVDWLVEFLNASTSHVRALAISGPSAARGVGKILSYLPMPSRRRLLLELAGIDGERQAAPGPLWSVRDSVRSLDGILEAAHDTLWVTESLLGAKTWAAVHDELARIDRRRQNANLPIEQDGLYAAIDGLIVDPGVTLVSVKETDTLFEWGEQMSNCIAGYRGSALTHQTYLFGVYRDTDLLANAEILPDGTVRQLYGRFNAGLEDGLDSAVRGAIDRALSATAIAA